MSSSQEPNSNFNKKEIVDFGIYYQDLVECPLNPEHKLRRHKLPYHVEKCRKNFPDKVACPFDNSYYLDECDMAKHLISCPHKPKSILSSMKQPDLLRAEHARNTNIIYNYDVNNHIIDEPYWD